MKTEPINRTGRLYKFCLWKAYFEKGFGLTTYFKYMIILFGFYEGFTASSMKSTMIIMIIYGLSCFAIGKIWFQKGIALTEAEVQNQFNLFQIQMRERLIKNNKK